MNHIWRWDFIFDRTDSDVTLKWLTIIDEFSRRCITLDVSRRFTSEDIINRLSELFAMYGPTQHIGSDNGPEFIANAIHDWLHKLSISVLYIEPGNPCENGNAESFHSCLRDELLSVKRFSSSAV